MNELKLSEALPLLQSVAKLYDLKLYKVKELRIARLLIANRYYNGPWNTEN
jgi:hypothetical protein